MLLGKTCYSLYSSCCSWPSMSVNVNDFHVI